MSADGAAGVAARALHVLHRIEDGVLALLLGAMILLAPAQIVLRNLADTSLPWGDPLLRVLVLWVGLLGALAASRSDRHIRMDVLSRVLPGRARVSARVATGLFTAAIAATVAWHGTVFVASELEFGSVAFGSVPVWMCQVVVPFSFAMIALRELLQLATLGRAPSPLAPPAV